MTIRICPLHIVKFGLIMQASFNVMLFFVHIVLW